MIGSPGRRRTPTRSNPRPLDPRDRNSGRRKRSGPWPRSRARNADTSASSRSPRRACIRPSNTTESLQWSRMPKAVRERVLIVGVAPKGLPRGVAEDHLDELERLVDTAGGEVVSRFVKERAAPDPATYIGKGAVEQIGAAARSERASLVVFDDELAPGQVRNLEKAWGDGIRVLDSARPDPRRLRAARALPGSAHAGRARAAPVPPAAAGRPLRPSLASGRRHRRTRGRRAEARARPAAHPRPGSPPAAVISRRSKSPGSCGGAAASVTGRSPSRVTPTRARRRSSTGSRATRPMPPTASSRRSTLAPGGRRRPSSPKSSSSTPSVSSGSCRPLSWPRFARLSPRSGTPTSSSTSWTRPRRGPTRSRASRPRPSRSSASRPTRCSSSPTNPMPAGSGARPERVRVSALTGEGIPRLEAEIRRRLSPDAEEFRVRIPYTSPAAIAAARAAFRVLDEKDQGDSLSMHLSGETPPPQAPRSFRRRRPLVRHTAASVRDANSLPTEGREEVRVAGARAKRRIRLCGRAPWRAASRCAEGADPQRGSTRRNK